MSDIFTQNLFSRSLINEAKLGAYYTDTEHCLRMGRMLEFPNEEVCVLEPSIGNAKAVECVTKDCPNKKIFGVELNQVTFNETRKNEGLTLLNADFMNGIKISNKAFSFVFSNPPYGVLQDEKVRMEQVFEEKIFNYLKPHGILVYVIPYSVLTDATFLKSFFARFHVLDVRKFDDKEYEKFHQVVIFAQRRSSLGYMRQWLETFVSRIDSLDKLNYLPELEDDVEKKFQVPSSEEKNIVYFTTKEFDVNMAAEKLSISNNYSVILEKGFLPNYTASELGNPPVPLKKDLRYLCSIIGAGQGLTGSEETHDLHLQRGVAKTVKSSHVEAKGDTGKNKNVMVETSSTRISLNIIQNDGTITTLA